ncbi:hypothetical protein JTB14_026670 [Gonioctena quinquepunctata]|nr:hypothetical protein JTB14_026670 [Gonioctena quinquepunctata]
MSEKRFLFILACLRFDNPDTRNDRKESKRAAAITYIFETFVGSCQEVYTLSEHTCIDEILVSFRGRCSFKMYFPKKTGKYGLKVMALTDAENNYFYNGYLYSGKQSNGSILTQQEKKIERSLAKCYKTNQTHRQVKQERHSRQLVFFRRNC